LVKIEEREETFRDLATGEDESGYDFAVSPPAPNLGFTSIIESDPVNPNIIRERIYSDAVELSSGQREEITILERTFTVQEILDAQS